MTDDKRLEQRIPKQSDALNLETTRKDFSRELRHGVSYESMSADVKSVFDAAMQDKKNNEENRD